MNHQFTLGVEEEFQIVDPASGELRSHVSELIAESKPALGGQIKPEMHQSIIEMGTPICQDVNQLTREMVRIRGELVAAAERVGLAVAAAGTHPFSSWRDLVDHAYLSPELGARIVRDAQTLNQALGYEMNSVEFAGREGVPYAIDFLNPAPDFDGWKSRRTWTSSHAAATCG